MSCLISRCRMWRIYSVCILALGWTTFSCSDGQNDIVAEYDQIQISLSDFERSYFNYWIRVPQNDSPELRKAYSRQLIEETAIARDALANGMVTEDHIAERLKREHEGFVRRRYLESVVKDTLAPVSEIELRTAAQRQQKELFVRQLYAPTREKIAGFHQRLQGGARFQDIAMQNLADTTMARQAGVLGWIGWGDTDLPVENELYQLEKGEYSEPVESLMGWHIFVIDSVRITYDFQTTSYPFIERDLRHKILQRRLDIAAADHIRSLVWTKQLAVKAGLFQQVWNYIHPLLDSPKHDQTWNKPAAELPILSPALSSEAIAWLDGEPFSVGEFVSALPSLSRELLRPNLKKALEIALRDKIITQEAIQQGFASDPVVIEKTERARTRLLYYAALGNADRDLAHELDYRRFYYDNKNRYIDYVESDLEEILVLQRQQALDLAKQISAGEDFAALANNYSIRANSTDGRLGFVKSTDNPLGAKAADLKMGNLYAPIETDSGWSVIRVGEQRFTYKPFEAVREQVVAHAQNERIQLLHQSLLPPQFDVSEIQFEPDQLARAFTEQSKTVF